MRKGRTHFEQVPFAVVELVLRQDSETERTPKQPLAQGTALKRRAITPIRKQKEKAPSEGPL
jgi:hypothetical protein